MHCIARPGYSMDKEIHTITASTHAELGNVFKNIIIKEQKLNICSIYYIFCSQYNGHYIHSLYTTRNK